MSRNDQRSSATDGGSDSIPVATGERMSLGRLTGTPLGELVDSVFVRLTGLFDEIAYVWVKLSFAFVFFWFGAQKSPILIRGASPVRPPVASFVEAVGFGGWIPLHVEVGLLFIGVYEVFLGGIWLLNWLEEISFDTSYLMYAITPMTLAHQTITFLPLVIVPGTAFRQTTTVGGLPAPLALDWLSAFIFKNLLFLGAFFYYYVEWAEKYGFRTPSGGE